MYTFFIQAPSSGSYIFYLAGDDQCELWISKDNTKVNARRILVFAPNQWTSPNQYDK